jgi:hypothetical protein
MLIQAEVGLKFAAEEITLKESNHVHDNTIVNHLRGMRRRLSLSKQQEVLFSKLS